MENKIITHPLKPIFDENSAVLILGTMPSPKSRENNFYYGHPQNRFWRVLSAIFGEKLPENNKERTALLLKHRIALWDVLESCEIKGAEDSSIKNPIPNDLSLILESCHIKAIFTTGKKLFRFMRNYASRKLKFQLSLCHRQVRLIVGLLSKGLLKNIVLLRISWVSL